MVGSGHRHCIGPPPIARGFGLIPAPVGALQSSDSDAELTRLVEQASGHLSDMFGDGLAYPLDILGDIDLPPGSEASIDRAKARGLAVVYLVAALEPAKIIDSVETLTSLSASASLQLDLGDAGPLLRQFWRGRFERISAAERLAFFGRMFGPSYGSAPAERPMNLEFDTRMLELCESLYRLSERTIHSRRGSVGDHARVRASARAVLENLSYAGGASTAFIAQEILRVLKESIAILSHESLRGAFGARNLWGVVAGIQRLSRKRTAQFRPYVERGKAGMAVIAWLGDIASSLHGVSGNVVRTDHPVIPAAVEWLQASLSISERQQTMAPPPPSPPTSPWADVAF